MNRRVGILVFVLSIFAGLALPNTFAQSRTPSSQSNSAPRAQPATAQTGSIVGTWALTAADKVLPDGTRVADYGTNPHGLAIFTADGHYTVEIFTADRANPRMSVHFGRYTVDASKQTISFMIDRASFSDWDDTTQVRNYELKGDELSWRVAARPDGSIPITALRRIAQ
jgi:hypothetical protein